MAVTSPVTIMVLSCVEYSSKLKASSSDLSRIADNPYIQRTDLEFVVSNVVAAVLRQKGFYQNLMEVQLPNGEPCNRLICVRNTGIVRVIDTYHGDTWSVRAIYQGS